MKQLFVPLIIAKKLKALGFNDPCFAYYEENSTDISYPWDGAFNQAITNEMIGGSTAPIHLQVDEYLKDKFNINIESYFDAEKQCWDVSGYDWVGQEKIFPDVPKSFITYKRALEWGFNEALNILLKKDKLNPLK